MYEDNSDVQQYKVVVNDEDQYSVWRSDLDSPAGWRDEGKVGSKVDCLAHIDRVWLDMRPRCLREAMERSELFVAD